MAKASRYVVASEFGTFRRETARTYSHVVIARGYRAELLEAGRLTEIKTARADAANYRATIARGSDPGDRTQFHRDLTAKWIATGELEQWAATADARAARLEAEGPITTDRASWGGVGAPEWTVLGWAGRLELARKVATGEQARAYREVAIVDVATGATVQHRRPPENQADHRPRDAAAHRRRPDVRRADHPPRRPRYGSRGIRRRRRRPAPGPAVDRRRHDRPPA